MNEFEEFAELNKAVDMNELGALDQAIVVAAYAEMISKVKPILLRHLAKKENGQSFLFRM